MTDTKMAEWVAKNGHKRIVQSWLRDNPPPPEWQGTPAEWAYTEMPYRLIKFFTLYDDS